MLASMKAVTFHMGSPHDTITRSEPTTHSDSPKSSSPADTIFARRAEASLSENCQTFPCVANSTLTSAFLSIKKRAWAVSCASLGAFTQRWLLQQLKVSLLVKDEKTTGITAALDHEYLMGGGKNPMKNFPPISGGRIFKGPITTRVASCEAEGGKWYMATVRVNSSIYNEYGGQGRRLRGNGAKLQLAEAQHLILNLSPQSKCSHRKVKGIEMRTTTTYYCYHLSMKIEEEEALFLYKYILKGGDLFNQI